MAKKQKESFANQVTSVQMSQVNLPTFIETRYYDWVKYGEDNIFPLYLQNLANRSALHNAILSSKVDNTCGDGITYENETDTEDPATEQFILNPNPYETLEDLIRKIVYDYQLYGGYALNVIWSKDRTTIAEIYHIDFAKLRCGKADERGMVNTYYFSEDWLNYQRKDNAPVQIPAFNSKTKEASQLIYVKEYRPGMDYYPVPSYVGALSYIETDVEIANFHLAHIKNGMAPSYMLNFPNGIPSDDERKAIEKQVKKQYDGTDNAGKIMITFSEDAEKAPTISPISPVQLDKQFVQLQDTVMQNILCGHKIVSPMLVGIKTPGQLGGANELVDAYNIYHKTLIKPVQDIILRTINTVTNINNLEELKIIPATPVSFTWSETIMSEILTVDEMRERVGLEPVEPSIAPTE